MTKKHKPTGASIDEALPLPPGEPEPQIACDEVAILAPRPSPSPTAPSPNYEERADGVRVCQCTLPLGPPARGYLNQHVDVQLTPPQATALKSLLAGLDHTGLRLGTGRRPATGADAIRWLLDQIARKGEGPAKGEGEGSG
jgi:hypothetical protein